MSFNCFFVDGHVCNRELAACSRPEIFDRVQPMRLLENTGFSRSTACGHYEWQRRPAGQSIFINFVN
jgi:uncharacterized protein with PIN domain